MNTNIKTHLPAGITLAIAGLILMGMMQHRQPENTGSISGKVSYEGRPPAPEKLIVDKDLEVCGQDEIFSEQLIVSKAGGVKNVVIQVVGAEGTFDAPATRPTLSQKGCRFEPHIQVIPAGVRMEILNDDGIAHNTHTLSVDNPSFNRQQPGSRRRMVTRRSDFSLPEIIPLKCDLHGWMSAFIVVLDHPHHAITDDAGTFEISGIRAGTYSLDIWHETLGTQTRKVTVTAGSVTELSFVFKP